MHRSNVVTNTICERLGGLADMLYGCAHRTTTFPITLRASVTTDGMQIGQPETYVACLSCGRHLAYDWTAMRIVAHNLHRQGIPDSSHLNNPLQDSRIP